MPALILAVIVIVVGVVIAVRGGPSTEPGSSLARWCLASGLVAGAGVAMVGQATFGWAPAFDPPEWLRIVTFWVLPAGAIGAAILGALSLKRRAGRALGITGLALAGLSALAFIVMVASVDY